MRNLYSPTSAQSVDSAKTSRRIVPATMKLVAGHGQGRNGDIGGGKYDDATAFLMGFGIENVVYDIYNRPQPHNESAIAMIAGGQCDTVTVNNVLNVIRERGVRERVVAQAADCLKTEGTAYFLIHEGSKGNCGCPGATRDGWQNNRKAETYVSEILTHFSEVARRGRVIVGRNPVKSPYRLALDNGEIKSYQLSEWLLEDSGRGGVGRMERFDCTSGQWVPFCSCESTVP